MKINQENNQVILESQKHGCLTQLLWFIFIGSWLGLIWTAIAWGFIASVILMPIGLKMVNKIPKVLLLRDKQLISIQAVGNAVVVTDKVEKEQKPFWMRAIWFLTIGWWFSGIWMTIAYILCALVVTFPLGAKMFEKVPWIVTLRNQ